LTGTQGSRKKLRQKYTGEHEKLNTRMETIRSTFWHLVLLAQYQTVTEDCRILHASSMLSHYEQQSRQVEIRAQGVLPESG
jgi:hypothetical protein